MEILGYMIIASLVITIVWNLIIFIIVQISGEPKSRFNKDNNNLN
jgi:hypothetical protein